MSVKEIRQISHDLSTVKSTGQFPIGRGHMFMFYKQQGVVMLSGKKDIGVGKNKRSYVTPKSKAVLTRKGHKMYRQLKGVI